MKLIYLGAEVPSNRTLLETTSATQVGVSFWRLRERGLPKNKDYLLDNYFNDDFSIYVYPGIPKGTSLGPDELAVFAAEYEDFIAHNIDRLTTFNEISEVDPAFVELQRKTAWAEVPPGKFSAFSRAPAMCQSSCAGRAVACLPSVGAALTGCGGPWGRWTALLPWQGRRLSPMRLVVANWLRPQ